jgi:hypothetical protein
MVSQSKKISERKIFSRRVCQPHPLGQQGKRSGRCLHRHQHAQPSGSLTRAPLPPSSPSFAGVFSLPSAMALVAAPALCPTCVPASAPSPPCPGARPISHGRTSLLQLDAPLQQACYGALTSSRLSLLHPFPWPPSASPW